MTKVIRPDPAWRVLCPTCAWRGTVANARVSWEDFVRCPRCEDPVHIMDGGTIIDLVARPGQPVWANVMGTIISTGVRFTTYVTVTVEAHGEPLAVGDALCLYGPDPACYWTPAQGHRCDVQLTLVGRQVPHPDLPC